ncbi:MAG: DUF2244 domain-containing protein [Pseudomonadota bacterium]|nr:DUF2244 domain-containing protein [Pseudomonadota bacterium]|tara:strand:+ start:1481 stop:1951 length:471 start_codon:yes stop_codon:yes gene_type:complete
MLSKIASSPEEYLIRGNDSLSMKGNIIFFLFISFISLSIAFAFFQLGLWIILPFAGFEMIFLAFMLLYICQKKLLHERVLITDKKVCISFLQRNTGVSFEVDKGWANVVLDKPIYKGHPYRLFIRSKGKEIEVGKMLTNKEKIEFSKILVKSIKKV